MATFRARLIARWLSDSSRFSDGRPLARSFARSLARPSPVRAAGFFSLVSHGRWKEEGHGGVDGERKSGREGGGRGGRAILRVWSSWSPRSTRSRGVALCVVCYGVLRRTAVSSHVNHHKHRAVRPALYARTYNNRDSL